MRWSNERLPRRYIEKAQQAGDARSFTESLTGAQAQGEFVLLRLRQLSGFLLSEFHQRFGVPFLEVFPRVVDLFAEELLVNDGGRIRLSDQGLLLADSIFASFF
jgi:coproporphyrinogen III oxidase-like Fe-S oxidoreductase